MSAEFARWLQDQINDRNWIPADLAKRAGMQGGSLSHILNGTRKVGPDSAIILARALSLPPETVFRKAGLLPEERITEDLPLKEIIEIAKDLSPEDRRTLLRIARSLMNEKG